MTARSDNTAVPPGLRVAANFVFSILLGAFFGVVATFAMQMGFMADVALRFGAIAGVLCSPALIFGLWYGPWLSGLAWIIVPTTAAAFLGGLLTPPNAGPALSMVCAISVYVLAALLRGVVGLKYHRLILHACPLCQYDLKGLPHGSICPECGDSQTNSQQN